MSRKSRHKTSKKSRIRGLSFSWILYLILISCSLTSVTMSKYAKSIQGTATATIASAIAVLSGDDSKVDGERMIMLDSLSEQSDCIFQVTNYNDLDEISDVAMDTRIRIEGIDGELPPFELYETDESGNIRPSPLVETNGTYSGKRMETSKKQIDIYVVRFTTLPTAGVKMKVTVIAEQVMEG